MSAGLDISSALTLVQTRQPATPAKGANLATIDKAAKEFESVFISQFIGPMFDGISTDGPFGGGPGEGIFRSMLIDRYSKSIASQGGFGLAAAVKRELLQAQENAK